MKAVRACTPSQNPGPMADWWAYHTDGETSPSVEEVLATHTDDDVVEDTASAFRTALRRADGIETAADLQDDAATERGDDTPADSLDYFAPAFRQALDPDERRAETVGATAGDGAARDSAPVEEEAPAESLHYFVPALPCGSGHEEQATPLGKAFVKMHEGEGAGTAETKAPEHSLDYFAPAFPQALGRTRDSGTEGTRAQTDDEEAQGAVEQLKAAMEDVSERGLAQLSSPERSELSAFDLDLDRLAERFFGAPSHDLVGLNEG